VTPGLNAGPEVNAGGLPATLDLVMIGGGYVGLVTAACLAGLGHRVVVVEKDVWRLSELLVGRLPIHEPGLAQLVRENLRRGRISFTSNSAAAVACARAVFIAVGTPANPADGSADLSFIRGAVQGIAPHLPDRCVVVIKSTVPVGTCDEVQDLVHRLRPEARISVASNPEFLRAGSAVADFMHPDRVVIGADDEYARSVMAAVYRPQEAGGSPLVFTDRRSAELTKYAANAFLAAKITFINEIADFCETVGADVEQVARGIGLDRRIGPEFLRAGPGLGGSCFPKDSMALLREGEARGVYMGVVAAVCRQNAERKVAMGERILAMLGRHSRGATVAVWGLTFKPDTDDMREAPALAIIPVLQASGVYVRAYDPKGMDLARRRLTGVMFADDAYACAEGADLLVLMTEWPEFLSIDLDRVRAIMGRPVVMDLRNVFDPQAMAGAGFSYHSLGRPAAQPPRLEAKPPIRPASSPVTNGQAGGAEVVPLRKRAAGMRH
jgi:UDPglucose 6-dehydrogenase